MNYFNKLTNQIKRLYRTTKYIKTRQLLYWIVHKFWLQPAPTKYPSTINYRLFSNNFIAFKIDKKPAFINDYQVVFLNIMGKLVSGKCWNDQSKPLLWLYNLHYFDDLSLDYRQRPDFYLQLIQKWIAENPAKRVKNKHHNVGWIPFTVAMRLPNWIIFLQSNPQVINQKILQSIYQQMLYLHKNIEYQFMANHLITDCKGLIYSAIYLNTAESDRVLANACKLLKKQLKEQILEDGGHFERSPMYHSLVLYDLLQIYNILNANQIKAQLIVLLKATIQKQLLWLDYMLHFDHDIAFFNDASFAIAPKPSCLHNFARSLGIDSLKPAKLYSHFLQQTQFYSYQGSNIKCIVDCGEVAPSYQPAHAHAQIASFELSLFDQRMIVNSGTSIYANTKLRQMQRATAAHNAIVIDNLNCSEVWHSFRVGHRAKLIERNIKNNSSVTSIALKYQGFVASNGSYKVVSRNYQIQDQMVAITDSILNPFQSATAIFHFHPDMAVSVVDNNTIEITGKQFISKMQFDGIVKFEIVDNYWYPEFSIAKPSQKCLLHFDYRGVVTTKIFWQEKLVN